MQMYTHTHTGLSCANELIFTGSPVLTEHFSSQDFPSPVDSEIICLLLVFLWNFSCCIAVVCVCVCKSVIVL